MFEKIIFNAAEPSTWPKMLIGGQETHSAPNLANHLEHGAGLTWVGVNGRDVSLYENGVILYLNDEGAEVNAEFVSEEDSQKIWADGQISNFTFINGKNYADNAAFSWSDDEDDEVEGHIKSTGTYSLQQENSKVVLDGVVEESVKLGNVLTFDGGMGTSYQIRTGSEGLDVVKVTQRGDGTSDESVLIQGTSFLEGPGGDMLTFSEPSEKEGGMDISWTITYTPTGGEEPVEPVEEHIKSTGSYSLSSPNFLGEGVGEVTTAKNGNRLTFNDGINHFIVQPYESSGTFSISQVDISGLQTVIAAGVSFVEDFQSPGNAILSFTQPSPILGGKDIPWDITYSAPSGEEPGDELKSDHPLEDYVYLFDMRNSIDTTIASFQSFKSGGGIYMEVTPDSEGIPVSQPDSKGFIYKLINNGVWTIGSDDGLGNVSIAPVSSTEDFAEFMSPEFTPLMGKVYKIAIVGNKGNVANIYAVSSTWYNSLEGGSNGDGTDYSLEITTPAEMETFLKEFNLDMIEISEYLNEVESMINKERDIFIKSKELNKDFESRKGNLDNFAKNLDNSRSEEITRLAAELNEEIEAAAQIKTRINEESAKIEVSITEIEVFDAKLAEESVYKSLGTAYNRMKKEYDAIGDVVGRDLSEEYESVLLESKNPAEIVAEKGQFEKGVESDYSQNNDSFFEHAKSSTQ